jgi:proteic killer suppression protein
MKFLPKYLSYWKVMIVSFGDKLTEMAWHGIRVRKLTPLIHAQALRKLNIIDSACSLVDLNSPPGNRLERKKGQLKDYYSIRVNSQWRIIFRWKEGHAYDVQIIDYHT